MKTIYLHHPLDKNNLCEIMPKVLVLGFFDGVHRGHQALISVGKKIAFQKDLPLAVITFDKAPVLLHQPQARESYQNLTELEEKKKLFAYFGVDIMYVIEYTSAFSQLTPTAFVDQYIVGLGAETVVAGFDYTFGNKAEANMKHLPLYANGRFEIICVPEVSENGKKISSRLIKDLLRSEPIEKINFLLGYTYISTGYVVHGQKRGRALGFPTANLDISSSKAMPKVGVYAVEVGFNHRIYQGMASIGHKVTFETNYDKTVEIHIFNFDTDIYGEKLSVYWKQYIRGEKKFDGAPELIEQMQQDQKKIENYFMQRQYLKDLS